jgi:hypothetical protein
VTFAQVLAAVAGIALLRSVVLSGIVTLVFPRGGNTRTALVSARVTRRVLSTFAGIHGLPYDHDPAPEDPIAIERAEFDAVYDDMAAAGLELHERDQAWRDFAGWRVNHDTPLLELAGMLEAPSAPWTSDRPALGGHTRMGRSHRPARAGRPTG